MFFKKISKNLILVFFGFFVAIASFVLAETIWEGTENIKDGEIISAKSIKNNFDYLYKRVSGKPIWILNWNKHGTGKYSKVISPGELLIDGWYGEGSKYNNHFTHSLSKTLENSSYRISFAAAGLICTP